VALLWKLMCSLGDARSLGHPVSHTNVLICVAPSLFSALLSCFPSPSLDFNAATCRGSLSLARHRARVYSLSLSLSLSHLFLSLSLSHAMPLSHPLSLSLSLFIALTCPSLSLSLAARPAPPSPPSIHPFFSFNARQSKSVLTQPFQPHTLCVCVWGGAVV